MADRVETASPLVTGRHLRQDFVAVQESFGPLPTEADLVEVLMSVDSTSIRAHQHAAGGRGDRWTATALTGGTIELHSSAA